MGLDDSDDSLKTFMKGTGSSVLNPNDIHEWTPIVKNITAGERDYYVFTIDQTESGFGFAPTYEILIFKSGNICRMPDDMPTDVALRVYHSFNDSITIETSAGSNYVDFQDGYVQDLAVSPLEIIAGSFNETTLKYSNLYVVIQLVNTTTGKAFDISQPEYGKLRVDYRLSISENDLVYQWDSRSWLQVLDTDSSSALLSTGNITSDSSISANSSAADLALYDVYVYGYNESLKISKTYNHSLCAIENGPYLVSSTGNHTIPETNMLEVKDLRIQKTFASYGGTLREQFYITGLNASTTYAAYLTKKIGRGNTLSEHGGVLFSVQYFTTDTDDSCSLIFGLNFCSDVAYSVPSSSVMNNNKTELARRFDEYAFGFYSNFSKALQLVACDTELDARYSPIKTCADCAASYIDWVCAVSIPRCSTEESPYYLHREKESNRNPFLDDVIKPVQDYYEILPCIDLCLAIARDCPSEFQFSCPDPSSSNELLLHSYNFFSFTTELTTCNFIGNSSNLIEDLEYIG